MIRPPECGRCILSQKGLANSFSLPDGEGSLGVVIVGEALGHDESIAGRPFQRKAVAGSKLMQCVEELYGYVRDQFLYYNAIQCQPPNNVLSGAWYEEGAISSCQGYRDKVIGGFRPAHGEKGRV